MALAALVATPSAAFAGDVRGTVTGIDALQPSAPPETGPRAAYYWEEPNGALDVRRPRASAEHDIAVVLTGPNVNDATQPVPLSVAGGRCRPGTAVIAPNATLRVQNQDWTAHEFYVVATGSTAPLSTFAAELTAPRSERQGQIPQAGRYELRDRRQPAFRCFLLVGEGQGRVARIAADGAYAVTLPPNADGAYTLRVYFEARMVAEATVRGSDRDVQGPALAVNANTAAAPGASAAPNGASAAPPANGASAAPSAEPHGRRHGGH